MLYGLAREDAHSMKTRGFVLLDAVCALFLIGFCVMYMYALVKVYETEEHYEISKDYEERELPCEIWCYDESLYGD